MTTRRTILQTAALGIACYHALLQAQTPPFTANLNRQQIAEGLAQVYGQTLGPLTYIPGMALIGRLRLGQVAAVEQIVAPQLASIETMTINSSLQIAGHLLFAELYERSNNPRYLAIAKRAADLGWDAQGNMLEAMPFHGDYSDAFFMHTPLLAKVGKLTGDPRYFDMALRHVNFLHAKLLREDGLYNHWPRTQAAWGRGNAFVAMGLALALRDIPPSHAAYERLVALYQSLITTLLKYQDSDGMWHNVIDHPENYAEFSATTMITFAIEAGSTLGLITQNSTAHVDAALRAWNALRTRIDSNYGFVDVCESTPGQDSLQVYLDRKALDGRDDRAGGMLLMLLSQGLPMVTF